MTLGDFRKILPYEELLLKVEVSGQQLYNLLENGVSKYPSFDGRWIVTSGIKFTFDPDQPEGSRIVEGSVEIDQRGKVEYNQKYTVATFNWLALGKDGYTDFLDGNLLTDKSTA